MSSLKEQKELFVSGLTGGGIGEVYGVTSIALTSFLALLLLKSVTEVSLALDFVLNTLTVLAAITIYADFPLFLHIAILLPPLIIYLRNKKKNSTAVKSSGLLSKKPFLTAYRAHMIVITNLAILAVDFNIFPRRFAKVETWGTSMMDMGVGSFVFSMGLVSSRALFTKKPTLVLRSIIKSLPVLFLGVARLISVKSLEYQEHTTEYGVHWNFFITLGLLPILLSLFNPVLNFIPRNVLGLILSLGYEVILTQTELLKFILTNSNRFESLITMNKEGLFSFWGYFSIFLFGQSFAFIMTSEPTRNNLFSINTEKRSKYSVTTIKGLIILTVVYQILFYLVDSSPVFYNVSRRLANLSYVLWVVSYNSAFLLGYCLIEKLFKVNATSVLLEAVNNNGLLAFLLGNLGTGLVNMSINTLKVNNMIAFGILVIYIGILLIILITLDRKKIYIKL